MQVKQLPRLKLAGKLKPKGKKTSCWLPVIFTVRLRLNSYRSMVKSRVWKYFPWEIKTNLVNIAKAAVEHAKTNEYNVVILDTAGRLHVDEDMMDELAGDQRELWMYTRPF